ncbi:flagellar basal-body MS-ring/collar protein FliF [Pseudooceanicola sp. C21-150M6]|uniref:flagellar basal-body MS-ring/collar protein FliF n=1 Tax=Pseudooceanicola sp. C21-150M6 TaxID=3434355 RepID=UPI003D7FF816
MQALIDNLKALGQGRLIALGLTGIVLAAALFFGVRTVMQPTYAALHTNLSPAEASQMVGALEQAGFRVRVDGGGTAISVPQEDVARARMELAGQGLVGDGSAGWELFDESSGLGMNTFMQKINRLRALEGELARSIQTLDGVEAARVHLVLPEREAFSRDRPVPSASIIVRGRAGYQVTTRQAQAIRALVASAVPEMSPGKVTVLTAKGETVLGEEGDGASETSQQAMRATVEDRIAARVTEILTARVGAGNARVTVSVDLTSERQVIRNQSFDPAQRVVRSTETREETRQDVDRAQGEVGVADDIPATLADPDGGTQSSNSLNRTDEVVNYEIGNTQSETIREPGQIQKVSVAVLVNGIYNVQDNGDVVYEERSAEELERLNQLVQAAIGYDQGRGDSISVDSLRFMDYSMDVGEPVGGGVADVLRDNLGSILRGLFALALIAAILRFGVMPLIQRALPEKAEGTADENTAIGEDGAELALTAEQPRSQAQIAGRPTAQAARPGAAISGDAMTGTILDPLGPGDPHDLVNVAAVQGGVQRGWLTTVHELIDNEPDQAMKVVKNWLAEGA